MAAERKVDKLENKEITSGGQSCYQQVLYVCAASLMSLGCVDILVRQVQAQVLAIMIQVL